MEKNENEAKGGGEKRKGTLEMTLRKGLNSFFFLSSVIEVFFL